MKTIDVAFVIFMGSVLLYSWITPGSQLPPSVINYEERVKFFSNPPQVFNFVLFVSVIYLLYSTVKK